MRSQDAPMAGECAVAKSVSPSLGARCVSGQAFSKATATQVSSKLECPGQQGARSPVVEVTRSLSASGVSLWAARTAALPRGPKADEVPRL